MNTTQTLNHQTINHQPIEFAAFIGLDWADQKHDLCLCPAENRLYEKTQVTHTPEALSEWMHGLRERFGGRPIAVALEQSRGALIHALMGYDFLVLFPIPPSMVDHFRKAFASSGAKDDPVDAELILEILLKHRDKIRPWKPDDVQTRLLTRLVETRRKMVNMRTQLAQTLGAALKESFPQALELVGEDLSTRMACDFLLKWPTLQSLKKAQSQTVRKFYYAHNCRRGDLIEKRLEKITQSVALTQDEAILESSSMLIETLARQLQALIPSIEKYDLKIQDVFGRHPDQEIFSSLPGAGEVMAPRLLTAFGSDRGRFSQALNMAQYSGIGPVTRRSGKSSTVHRRLARPKFILQSFHEFAGCSIRFSSWAKAVYDSLRSTGKGHHASIRALAFKWIRVIFRCWQNRKPYDENYYLSVLKKQGSPFANQSA